MPRPHASSGRPSGSPSRRGVRNGLVAYAIFFGIPTIAFSVVGRGHPPLLDAVHYAVATAFGLTALMMLIETLAAYRRRPAPTPSAWTPERMPLVSVIVSAYLPNERDLIAETILHLSTAMRVPSHGLQIILAYNSPTEMAVERDLASLQRLHAGFQALRVPDSTTKAENIVAALRHAKGEMTVLLDADHQPHPDAFERAYRWLLLGYDVVQGRCVVRNDLETLLTRYVAIEFENMYAVGHTGRSLALDTAIFAGSNGYWRTPVLQRIAMDPRMLTEDIDATVRARLEGCRIIHDRSIISSELATPDARRWWTQRLRWAQGWLQVTVRHQRAVWRSKLPWQTKIHWTYLLSWRQIFPLVSLQLFSLLSASAILHRPIPWVGSTYLALTAALTLVTGPLSTLATFRVAQDRTKERLRWWFVVYALTNVFYVMLKNAVLMVAMVQEGLGQRTWVVTTRASSGPPQRVPRVASTRARGMTWFASGAAIALVCGACAAAPPPQTGTSSIASAGGWKQAVLLLATLGGVALAMAGFRAVKAAPRSPDPSLTTEPIPSEDAESHASAPDVTDEERRALETWRDFGTDRGRS